MGHPANVHRVGRDEPKPQNQALFVGAWEEMLRNQLAHDQCEAHPIHEVGLVMADPE